VGAGVPTQKLIHEVIKLIRCKMVIYRITNVSSHLPFATQPVALSQIGMMRATRFDELHYKETIRYYLLVCGGIDYTHHYST